MKFDCKTHRNAYLILTVDPDFQEDWFEIESTIESITDEMIIECYEKNFPNNKSISPALNHLIKDKLTKLNWKSESAIFQDLEYSGGREGRWRLDFAKNNISVEVAFNHSGVVAWNLLKPVLASELNHVEKAIQTKIGIVICATKEMKKAGNFDSAIGTYEDYVKHLKPMMNQLTTPLLIVGLKAPKTFKIEGHTVDKKKIGKVVKIN